MFPRKMLISCLLLLGSGCALLSGCEPKKPSAPPEKLTIAIPKNINPTLVKIADARGFFREEGLDVTLQLHSFGKASLQSLLDGKADLATAADTPIMFAIMKGARLSILTTIETSTRNEAIVARKDRGIASAADLKGHRIGVTLGTSADYSLDSYLFLNALSRKDMVIIDMKPEEMTDALLQGRVDSVSVWNPLVTILRKKLGERGIMLHSDSAYTQNFNLVSMQALTRQRPETVQRFLRALVKAEGFVAANLRESQRIMSEFSGMDGELLTELWNKYQFNLSLSQSLLFTLDNQARWAVKNGLTDRNDVPDFLEAIYIDGLKSVKPDAVRIVR